MANSKIEIVTFAPGMDNPKIEIVTFTPEADNPQVDIVNFSHEDTTDYCKTEIISLPPETENLHSNLSNISLTTTPLSLPVTPINITPQTICDGAAFDRNISPYSHMIYAPQTEGSNITSGTPLVINPQSQPINIVPLQVDHSEEKHYKLETVKNRESIDFKPKLISIETCQKSENSVNTTHQPYILRKILTGTENSTEPKSTPSPECSTDHNYSISKLDKSNAGVIVSRKYETQQIPAEKYFKCKLCDMSFDFKYLLDMHAKSHRKGKYFKCNMCRKCFRTSNFLKIHQQKHFGQFYRCDPCGKCYIHKGLLVAHMNTHNNSKPFKCEKCGQGFRTRFNFIMHARVHANEKTKAFESFTNAFESFIAANCDDNGHIKKMIRKTNKRSYTLKRNELGKIKNSESVNKANIKNTEMKTNNNDWKNENNNNIEAIDVDDSDENESSVIQKNKSMKSSNEVNKNISELLIQSRNTDSVNKVHYFKVNVDQSNMLSKVYKSTMTWTVPKISKTCTVPNAPKKNPSWNQNKTNTFTALDAPKTKQSWNQNESNTFTVLNAPEMKPSWNQNKSNTHTVLDVPEMKPNWNQNESNSFTVLDASKTKPSWNQNESNTCTVLEAPEMKPSWNQNESNTCTVLAAPKTKPNWNQNDYNTFTVLDAPKTKPSWNQNKSLSIDHSKVSNRQRKTTAFDIKKTLDKMKEKPYKCPHCEMSFDFECLLNVHKEKHEQTKRYRCTECGLIFNTTLEIEVHQKSHKDKRLFRCDECGKSFKLQINLVSHSEIHKSQNCSETLNETYKSLRYQERTTRITKMHLYECDKCELSFKYFFLLVQHKEKAHGQTSGQPPITSSTLNSDEGQSSFKPQTRTSTRKSAKLQVCSSNNNSIDGQSTILQNYIKTPPSDYVLPKDGTIEIDSDDSTC